MSSPGWFVAVGVAAALTHAAVFEALRRATPLWPEACNALGFVVAFTVSFVGHRRLSFAGSARSWSGSLWRFGLTALAGLATNEAVFAVLLRGLQWPALAALVAGMAAAAVQTWWLSRHWAFSGRPRG